MTPTEPTLEIAVHTSGPVSPTDVEYARDKLARAARGAPGPVLGAHLDLHAETNPAHERPATVKARLDVNGRSLRVHVAAPSMREAVDALDRRLQGQLDRAARRAESQHLRHRGEGEWHHGDPPTERPGYFPRPVEEREIVRHKTWADHEISPEDAVVEAELLDYDFFLFRNRDTGHDSVVWRTTVDGWELLAPDPASAAASTAVPVSGAAAPTLTVGDALERLNTSDEPIVFFLEPGTGRGLVAYRRFDGHYGLIQPAD